MVNMVQMGQIVRVTQKPMKKRFNRKKNTGIKPPILFPKNTRSSEMDTLIKASLKLKTAVKAPI